MPEDTKEIYLSSCIPSELLDDDDDLTPSEDVGNHLVQYEFADLIKNIGMLGFKETYLNFIDDIKKQSFLNQQVLSEHMIEQIQKIYNFDFPEKIILSDQNDINNFYRFIEFLEYDNEEFLIEIFKGFNVDFNKIEPDEFCQKNKQEIIKQINFYNNEQINYGGESKLPNIFLNLYDTLEDNIFIPIISRMILKNKEVINNELKIRKLQKERI